MVKEARHLASEMVPPNTSHHLSISVPSSCLWNELSGSSSVPGTPVLQPAPAPLPHPVPLSFSPTLASLLLHGACLLILSVLFLLPTPSSLIPFFLFSVPSPCLSFFFSFLLSSSLFSSLCFPFPHSLSLTLSLSLSFPPFLPPSNPSPNRSPLCPEALRVAAGIYSSPPPNTRPAWQV